MKDLSPIFYLYTDHRVPPSWWVSWIKKFPQTRHKKIDLSEGISILNESESGWDDKADESYIAVFDLDKNFHLIHGRLKNDKDSGRPISVLLFPKNKWHETQSLIHSVSIDFMAPHDLDDQAIESIFHQAQILFEQKKKRLNQFIEEKNKNKELEGFVQHLHFQMQEQIQFASEFEDQVEKEKKEWQRWSQWMRSLSLASTPEDILRLIRYEVKLEKHTSEPILAYSQSSGEARLLYFQKGQIFDHRTLSPWPEFVDFRYGEEQDTQYFAHECGRPMNKVLVVPLLQAQKNNSRRSATSGWLMEINLSKDELETWRKNWERRIQTLQTALDRVLLGMDLKSASYLWENTFDHLEDPVAIINKDFSLIRANQAFLSGSDLSSESDHPLCHASFSYSSQPCWGCPLLSSEKNEPKKSTSLTEGRVKQGRVKRGQDLFVVHSYPIHLQAEDSPRGFVHHYSHVTEELKLRERMIQNEKMVALGHLAGNIAHELNNPLTGLRSLAQFWLKQMESSQNKNVMADLHEIEQAAARSQGIIANLLQFSRMERVRPLGVVRLQDQLDKIWPLLKMILSVHQVEILGPEDPVVVQADGPLLQQVLFNILKNAGQAMGYGGRIKIFIESFVWRELPAWRVLIQDSGPGIPPSLLESIFTPFFTTKPEGEGTGLGLSLSRDIMHHFGGDIEVQSKEGEGTTFALIFRQGESEGEGRVEQEKNMGEQS